MDTPSRKRPSSRLTAEEVTTFLFDDTYDTSPSSGLGASSLFGEEMLSEAVTSSQFQLDSLENTIVEDLLSDPSETEPESPVRSSCVSVTNHPAVVSLIEQQQFLQTILDGVNSLFPEFSFSMARNGSNGAPVLTVTQKDLYSHPPLGLISRIQLTIEYKKYSIFVLMRLWRTGEVKSIEDAIKVCQDITVALCLITNFAQVLTQNTMRRNITK